LAGRWDAVLGVGVGSSRDDVLSLLLDSCWVLCGGDDGWNVGAAGSVGHEVGGWREGRSRDGEELAGVNIVDESEEEALAAGMGIALGHAKGCGGCGGKWLEMGAIKCRCDWTY
jgi:hypothetical protein